jgi:hypothetical protein
MDYQALAAELTDDPLARGYAGMDDDQAAADLNTAYRTRTRAYVYGWEIFNATDSAEYGALTDAQKSSWDALCAIFQIDTASGVAKSREAELFGAGTTTRSNLQALRIEDISRATELGLPWIRTGDVTYARSL